MSVSGLGMSRISFYLVGPYAECLHERVAEYLLTEIAARHRLHGKDSDSLFTAVEAAQRGAHLVVYGLGIGDYHQAFHVLAVADDSECVGEETALHAFFAIFSCRKGLPALPQRPFRSARRPVSQCNNGLIARRNGPLCFLDKVLPL